MGTKLNRFVPFLAAAMVAGMLLAFACESAGAQEIQARHYQSQVYESEMEGVYHQNHILVGGDGRMASVVMTGGNPNAPPEMTLGFSGPRILSDVDDAGNAAFCFEVDDYSADIPLNAEQEARLRQVIGKKMCVVWLANGDEMFITNGPFGTAISPLLTWCGQTHFIPRDPQPSLQLPRS